MNNKHIDVYLLGSRYLLSRKFHSFTLVRIGSFLNGWKSLCKHFYQRKGPIGMLHIMYTVRQPIQFSKQRGSKFAEGAKYYPRCGWAQTLGSKKMH